MEQDNLLIEGRKIFLTNEMVELKRQYKTLKDLAIKASPDNQSYINYLEEEFHRHIEKMVNEISSMK